jgi:hypothetical protein
MLKNTKSTAPKYLESSIVALESGFEMSRSIVPFSSIEGMNEAVDMREKNIINDQESFKKPTSAALTVALISAREITPSTASILTMKTMNKITIA